MQATIPRQVITGAVLPRSMVASAVLVVGFALLTAAAAQVVIPLGFTPVPITGQTFAVLLAGAALGSTYGAASQLLYVALGAVGLPFYAEGAGGWHVVSGATGGYLVGFVVAAWVVGYLAERKQDRNVLAAASTFLSGSVLIYAIGVPWLYFAVDSIDSGDQAISAGLLPFIPGDVVKIILAALALPLAWKVIDKVKGDA
jgi:biotin transport system substrate-specific component